VYLHTDMVEVLCPVGKNAEAPLTLEQRLPAIAYFGYKTHATRPKKA
jgi:hypothetical protein